MKTLVRLLTAVLSFVLLLFQPALAGAPPLQWQKTFGGSNYERGFSVQQTIDGGFIITGHTDSFGAGYSDVYLIKTDQNGDMQWQKTFGGSKRDYGWSVQQTTDGGYIIAGSTESYGAGRDDFYLIKTDSYGNSQWQKTFGGSSPEYARSVRQTSDGGYIIAGQTYPYATYDINIYLVKTDSNGNSQWQKTFGGIDTSEYVFSVQQTTDGGYIMAGYTDLPDTAVKADVYLIKTDPNGNSQWQKTFGGTYYDIALSVQQTMDGGYIIAGYTEYSFKPLNYCDVYIIKTDPNGNSLWQKHVGGSNRDYGYSVQQTADGGYIIGGYTYDDPDNYTHDVYLIKLCSDGTLSADFNCNGTVYFDDLKVLLDQWLQPPPFLYADIAPEPGDGIVNFPDFAVLAQDWLKPIPGRARNPDPPNNVEWISTTAKLSWTAGPNAVSHDVYFGTSSLCMFQGNQTNTTFDPGTMAYNTRYYWRIDEVNPLGTTTGEVWTFFTAIKPPPPPPS